VRSRSEFECSPPESARPGGGAGASGIGPAAGGDQLRLDFDGQSVSPTTAAGTYEFAGGTGRFRDASETADFEAVLDDQGHVEVVFDGSIRYRARASDSGGWLWSRVSRIRSPAWLPRRSVVSLESLPRTSLLSTSFQQEARRSRLQSGVGLLWTPFRGHKLPAIPKAGQQFPSSSAHRPDMNRQPRCARRSDDTVRRHRRISAVASGLEVARSGLMPPYLVFN
jgi:hypothetical protein